MKYSTSCNTWHLQDQRIAKYCYFPHIRPLYLMCIVSISNNFMDRLNSLSLDMLYCNTVREYNVKKKQQLMAELSESVLDAAISWTSEM